MRIHFVLPVLALTTACIPGMEITQSPARYALKASQQVVERRAATTNSPSARSRR